MIMRAENVENVEQPRFFDFAKKTEVFAHFMRFSRIYENFMRFSSIFQILMLIIKFVD